VGGVLAATLAAAAWAGLSGDAFAALVAVACQSLVLPVAWLHACPAGRARSGMLAYVALLALGGSALVLGRGLGLLSAELASEGRDLLFLHGAGITGLLGRALIGLYAPKSTLSPTRA
jgi:hypothetical protein